MRSATSKMSCRLWEMSTTPRPRSANRRTRSSTWRVCATPSAAVGSSSIDDLRVPHHRLGDGDGLALAAGEPGHDLAHRLQRRHREAVEGLLRRVLHGRLVEDPAPGALTTEEHVGDDVEVVRQRQVLVHDLDPEPGGVAGPVDGDGLPLEEDLAVVEGIDADDPLDERRLAGAVVADEGHHLAGLDLEVDLVQRPDRAEGLRAAPTFEEWGVSHQTCLSWRTALERERRGNAPAQRDMWRGGQFSWQKGVSATSPTQISSTVRKPSAMTVSAMLSAVTPIGTRAK